jgi:hypothetical protein
MLPPPGETGLDHNSLGIDSVKLVGYHMLRFRTLRGEEIF